MLSIGLTGGIGSGKSTVARVFETLGIPVYYADDAAKALMNAEGPLKEAIIRNFGAEAYQSGQLDRAWLGAQVFGSPEKLQLLNSIVHPATIADAAAWMDRQTAPYAIKEAALLFESDGNKTLDYVIGVSAPEAVRIRRVMARDKTDEASIRKRMAGQLDEADKMQRCDFIIVNDGIQMVIPQVLQVHETLLRRSADA
jgi:dephospho-CoA kinase